MVRRMRPVKPLALLPLLAAWAIPAAAQPYRPAQRPVVQAPPPASPAAPATPSAPVSSEPQRTTSTFGDWTLRCERPENAPQTCEVGQSLFAQGQQVAQTAIGHAARAESLRMTVLVPVNVSLAAPVRMTGPGTDATPVELAWRRCVPAGCLADTVLGEDLVRKLRIRTEPARLVFMDAANRDAGLPFSPRGLAQALDALAREEQR